MKRFALFLNLAFIAGLSFPIISSSAINFEIGSIYGVGKRASTIDTGDFDGDGDLDFAVANIYSDSVTFGYNDGNGNFETKEIPLDGGLQHPVALGAGELDGDHRDDLVVVNVQHIENSASAFRGANVIFWFSEEGGTFFQMPLGILGVPSSVEIADIDGDQDNDVLISNNGEFSFTAEGIIQTDAGIFPFENRGMGRFSALTPINTFGSLVDIIPFDIDEDGMMDVVGIDQGILTFDSNFNFVYIDQMLNTFKGTENGLSQPSELELPLNPWSLDAGDFDGDGKQDVAVSIVGDMDVASFLGTNAAINIYQNTGNRFNAFTTFPTPGIAFAVLAADFDLDGDDDLAVTIQELSDIGGSIRLDPFLKLYENDGTGIFEDVGTFNLEEEPRYATKGDFDNDGDVDLAILCTILDSADSSNAIEGRVYVFFNNARTTNVGSWELY